jgi:hypothetical protein
MGYDFAMPSANYALFNAVRRGLNRYWLVLLLPAVLWQPLASKLHSILHVSELGHAVHAYQHDPAHGHGLADAHKHKQDSDHDHKHDNPFAGAHHSLEGLFSGHSQHDKATCQLFDTLCAGEALGPAASMAVVTVLSDSEIKTAYVPIAQGRIRLTPEARAPPTLI